MQLELTSYRTESFPEGKVTFSGDYPVYVDLSEPIPVGCIAEHQELWSERLKMPVVFLANRYYPEQYWMFHRDSVLVADTEDYRETGKFLTDINCKKEDNYHVLGLWDGQHISDLLPVIEELGYRYHKLSGSLGSNQGDYSYLEDLNVIVLQGRNLTKEECRKHGVGLKSLSLAKYFVDTEGRGLIYSYGDKELVITDCDITCPVTRKCLYQTKDLSSTMTGLLAIAEAYQGYREYSFEEEIFDYWEELRYPSSCKAVHTSSANESSSNKKHRRTLLRAFRLYGSYRYDLLTESGLSFSDMHSVILESISIGDLEPEDSQEYPSSLELTVQGRAKTMKSFAKRLKRKTLDNLVEKLIDRADEALHHNFLGAKVDRIAIFGSYLNEDAKDFGDLDVVIETSRKVDAPSISSYGDAYALWWQVMDAYDNNQIQYRPVKIDREMPFLFERDILSRHMRQSNHAISNQHRPDELLDIGVKEVLVVYDYNEGGRVEPKRVSAHKLWPDKVKQLQEK